MSAPRHYNPPPKFGLRERVYLHVIAHCPDCGWPIYEGHSIHRCMTPVLESDEGAYTLGISYGFDCIVLSRKQFANGAL